MLGQQRLDRTTQQRGVVTRHRRHEKHRRMHLVGRPLEMDQVAERLMEHGHFPDRHLHAVDLGRGQPEFRLGEAPRRAFDQFGASGDGAPYAGVRSRKKRVLKRSLGSFRHKTQRVPSRLLEIVKLIEQDSPHIHRLNGRRDIQLTDS